LPVESVEGRIQLSGDMAPGGNPHEFPCCLGLKKSKWVLNVMVALVNSSGLSD
jgi:hypothetical protein